MDMVRSGLILAIAFCLTNAGLQAEALSLTIGNPIAGQGVVKKIGSPFIFRVNNCADMSNAKLTTAVEGLMNGVRKSIPLSASLVNPPNVYAINQAWGNEGTWVVAIAATCLNETAGAIVPVTNTSFVRESTELLSHAPTASEIEAALKAFAATAPAAR